jgi:hypothetical protein
MSSSRARPLTARSSEARSVSSRPREFAAGDVVLAGLAVVAACIAFRGALAYFFAQDDFTGLARARGLMPPVSFPWRWLSGQLYFDVMRSVAGLAPLPYRVASLAAHGVCVVLVYRLCRRFTPSPAAALGAVFFGTHPALFTALYSISGIGEILAVVFGLGSVLVAGLDGRRAWLALPLFAASLMCKESTLLLPLLAFAPSLSGRRVDGPRPAPVVPWAMAGLSLVYLVAFLTRDVFGVRADLVRTAPYALRFDGTVVGNLLTYLGWTVRVALPAVKSFTDAVDRGVFLDGAILAVAWLAGLAAKGLRDRGWREAGAWYALTLLPVLPLSHHTYHYYLYAPLVGTALALAALAANVTTWLSARVGPRAALTPIIALGVGLAVNGALLIHKIEVYPFLDPELRSDATVDRARIAANAVGDLKAAALPAGTQLWFWSPVSIVRQREARGQPGTESYWETNVRSALYDGLAARVFVPAVTATRFVRRFEPAGDSVRYAVYLPNGHVRVGTPAELDSVLRLEAEPEAAPQ